MKKVDQILAHLTKDIDLCNDEIKKFAEDVTKNPTYALEWADSKFETAARIYVFSVAKKEIEIAIVGIDTTKEDAEAKIIQHLNDIVFSYTLTGSKHPSFSTSTCTNLMHQHKTSQWAKLYEYIRRSQLILS